MFIGSTYFYVDVYYSILTLFVCNFLRILIHFTLATPLVTPPCNPISPISYLSTISWCPVLNSVYTLSTSLIVGSALCHTIRFFNAAVILESLITSSSLNPRALSSRSALVKYFIFLSFFSPIRLL